MCIRDSNKISAEAYNAGMTSVDRSKVQDNWMKEKTRIVVACLLYTSDAADERSSVDLGGRRIIKKKQHIRYG